jgi:hypothetical protein
MFPLLYGNKTYRFHNIVKFVLFVNRNNPQVGKNQVIWMVIYYAFEVKTFMAVLFEGTAVRRTASTNRCTRYEFPVINSCPL